METFDGIQNALDSISAEVEKLEIKINQLREAKKTLEALSPEHVTPISRTRIAENTIYKHILNMSNYKKPKATQTYQREISRYYGISNNTVNRRIAKLAADGLLIETTGNKTRYKKYIKAEKVADYVNDMDNVLKKQKPHTVGAGVKIKPGEGVIQNAQTT